MKYCDQAKKVIFMTKGNLRVIYMLSLRIYSEYSWIVENRFTQPNKLLQKQLVTKMTATFLIDRYLWP